MSLKECFGTQCATCKDFFACDNHFPLGCWGEDDEDDICVSPV